MSIMVLETETLSEFPYMASQKFNLSLKLSTRIVLLWQLSLIKVFFKEHQNFFSVSFKDLTHLLN